MAQVLQSLPPVWGNWIEFQASGVGLVHPQLLWPLGMEPLDRQSLFLCLPFK